MNRFITAGASLALIAAPLVATTATTATTANASTATDSFERAAAPSFSVTAKLNKTTAIANEDVVKITGSVSPKAAGEKVLLQQRLDGKSAWKPTGTAKVKATGKFVLKDDPSVAGTRHYRVLKPASGKVAKGVSKELELVVYGWEKLGYRESGPAANVEVVGATISTDYYGASITSVTPGTPATIEYTLGKKCLKLRSTYALTDSTATGGTGSVALKVDGTVAFASQLVLSQVIADQETDVSNAFRISYEFTSSAAPDAKVAAAGPEVLCTT